MSIRVQTTLNHIRCVEFTTNKPYWDKDDQGWRRLIWITNDKLEKIRLNYPRCASCDIAPLRLVFTSDGVVVGVVVGVVIRRVERYDLVKTKPTESEAEH